MLPELTIFYPSFLIPVQRYKLLCSHTSFLGEKFQNPRFLDEGQEPLQRCYKKGTHTQRFTA